MKILSAFNFILFALFGFICALICCRIIYTGKISFLFLIWNLFLAWLPFFLSNQLKKSNTSISARQIFMLLLWLLFFPNSLYLVTDLIHLDDKSIVPKWFDAVIIFSACFLGLLLGFISLLQVENFLMNWFSNKKLNIGVFIILFVASFGVYLGRFLRWNSWDIVSNPFQLFYSILNNVFNPIDHWYTWAITIIFTLFYYLVYWVIKKIPDCINQVSA
jgi:uncharacterized membrane protein